MGSGRDPGLARGNPFNRLGSGRRSHLPQLPDGSFAKSASLRRDEFPLFELLTERHGRNLCEAGLLVITGSSCDEAREKLLPRLIDPLFTRCWTSKNAPNQWLQFDFVSVSVCVSGYSLKTYPLGKGFSHLRSWIVHGSVDGVQWFTVSTVENCADMNARSKTVVITVTPPVVARSLRITQTGPNHAGDHFFILTNIEFIGTIVSEEERSTDDW
jgi:hypothetical protein